MKALLDIFAKPLPAFQAFIALKDELQAFEEQAGQISKSFSAMEAERNQSIQTLFSDPTETNFRAAVTARLTHETAKGLMAEVYSSIGTAGRSAIITSQKAMTVLRGALEAYAKELSAVIGQIEADARALADRNGVEYSEPPSVATLRTECEKVREGIGAIKEAEAPRETLWRVFSPLIRLGSQGGTLTLPK